MTVVIAIVAAISVYLVVSGGVSTSLADSLGRYLMPADAEPAASPRKSWSAPWVLSVLVGGLIGALGAQGDLFISGTGRSAPLLTLLGGVGGYFVWSSRRTNAQTRKARNLRFELPTVDRGTTIWTAELKARDALAADNIRRQVRADTASAQ